MKRKHLEILRAMVALEQEDQRSLGNRGEFGVKMIGAKLNRNTTWRDMEPMKELGLVSETPAGGWRLTLYGREEVEKRA